MYILNRTFVCAVNQHAIESEMQNSKEPLLEHECTTAQGTSFHCCFMWFIFCRCWYVRLLRVIAQDNY